MVQGANKTEKVISCLALSAQISSYQLMFCRRQNLPSLAWQDRGKMRKEEILALLRLKGLERFAPVLERLMLPAIRIAAHEVSPEDLAIGVSKMGGLPDLPEEIAWPEWQGIPLAFLAQFHLPDLLAYDLERVLPPSGWLYFFYEAESQPGGLDLSHQGSWRVLYYHGPLAHLRRRGAPDALPLRSHFLPLALEYSLAMTLPANDATAIIELGLGQDEAMRYLGAWLDINTLAHQLLGHPAQIQGEMQPFCELMAQGYSWQVLSPEHPLHASLEGAAREWRLLFQVNTLLTNAYGYKTGGWGDGLLYYWIRQADLRKHEFDRVWLHLQST